MALTVRALSTKTFGFGRYYSRPLSKGQSLTIDTATISARGQELLDGVRAAVAAGYLEVLSADPQHGLPIERQFTSHPHMHLLLGADHGSGMLLPNTSTLHYLTLGGSTFILGTGHITGSSTSALITNLMAAIAADANFQASGAKVDTSTSLASPAATAAAVTLTISVNPTDGDTFTVGGHTYRFKSTLAQAYDVKLDGSSAATSLTHAIKAITATGTAGTDYYTGTLANTQVSAVQGAGATATITALTAGSAGNAIASTSSFTSGSNSFNHATLVGGTDTQGLIVIDGDGIADWSAWEAASGLANSSGGALSTPYASLVWFDPTTHDTVVSNEAVHLKLSISSAAVSRGYVAVNTGLTNLTNRFAYSIVRSGTRVVHDGSVSVQDSQVLLIQNDGSADFQANDVLQVFASNGAA
jgi:hypothetical protein